MNILLSDYMKQMKMISINGVAQVIMKIVVQDIGKNGFDKMGYPNWEEETTEDVNVFFIKIIF